MTTFKGPYVLLTPEEREFLRELLTGSEEPVAVALLERIVFAGENPDMALMRTPAK
jgi:hypothetical protein